MREIIINENTPKNPITLAGQMAGVAYGTDTSDQEKNYKRGLQCIKDGHGRMLEFADVYFSVSGYSNRVTRQIFRHVGDGLTAVQESTRYVDFSNGFDYIEPPSMSPFSHKNASEIYANTMETIRQSIKSLMELGVPKEDAQMLIPLGATTKFSMKKNMRNLAEMSRVRMCNRTYWEFREFMQQLKKALSEYSPEWKTLCDMLLYPKCEKNKICEEKFGCGRYPKQEQ